MAAANLSVTVVGRCFGAEKYDEAKRYGVRCDQIALILVLLTSALFIPLLPALLGQYHPTPEVLAMAKKLLCWSIPSLLLFWPRSNTLPSTLRAANDTLYPSVVSLAVLWVVTIGLGYVLAVLLVTEARHRLRSKAIPKAFRGLPITLVYIGVLALAIYGFTGHSVIL